MAEKAKEQPVPLNWQSAVTLQKTDADRALVEKYFPQIMIIADMDPNERQTLFANIGFDEDKIKNKPEYASLQERNRQNMEDRAQSILKIRKTTFIASMVSWGGLTFAAFKEKFGQKPGIATIFTTLLGFASTIISYFVATEFFNAKNEKEAKQLSEEGRNAWALELAKSLDGYIKHNPKTLLASPEASTEELVNTSPPQSTQEKLPTSNVTPPLPSFGDRIKGTEDASAQMTIPR